MLMIKIHPLVCIQFHSVMCSLNKIMYAATVLNVQNPFIKLFPSWLMPEGFMTSFTVVSRWRKKGIKVGGGKYI